MLSFSRLPWAGLSARLLFFSPFFVPVLSFAYFTYLFWFSALYFITYLLACLLTLPYLTCLLAYLLTDLLTYWLIY